MDTNAPKTPATLPFTAWQSMAPEAAAREIHSRVAALPDPLRRAAVAWLRPEAEMAEMLAKFPPVGACLQAIQDDEVACKQAPTKAPLQGIPYLLKDLFDITGVPTRAGSSFLDKIRSLPDRDSRIAKTLARLGAVCAGKTHLVEFASGLTGENPHFGDCPHPRFPDRLSGGSSSGSAALVASGVVPLAIGTDTGGSVRVPAAWCGLFGFRMTPGDDLIRDAFPLAPSMDTAGWFTATATDMLTAWQALVPLWRRDYQSRELPASNDLSRGTDSPASKPYRGCYLNARRLVPGMIEDVAAACDYAAASLTGHADSGTEAALLQSWQNAVGSYVTIGMSEAHAVHRDWLAPYREHYDPVIWQRFTDAGHFSTADIARARHHMLEMRSVWQDFFRSYDFLVLPAVPCSAPTKAEATAELRRNILTLTAPASLGGLPVLSLPVPLKSGLSAGLQIILPSVNSPVVQWLLSR